MHINIDTFLVKLINNTKADACVWDILSYNQFRLLLKNGSVVLEYNYDSDSKRYDYKLQLYDSQDCFAVYKMYAKESSSRLYIQLSDLHKAIQEYRQRLIESKIATLYDDL